MDQTPVNTVSIESPFEYDISAAIGLTKEGEYRALIELKISGVTITMGANDAIHLGQELILIGARIHTSADLIPKMLEHLTEDEIVEIFK